MKCLFAVAVLIFTTILARPAWGQYLDPQLERGVAITDPAILRMMEDRGYGIDNMLATGESKLGILSNLELANSPGFAQIISSIKSEVQSYQAKHSDAGIGINFSKRLFDVSYLTNDRARFVLVGAINRMDRAYEDIDTCGETRLLYRMAYNVNVGTIAVASRLPMTINLVFHARANGATTTCQELAQAWLNIKGAETRELALEQVIGATGPLGARFFDRKQLKQLELNLQLVRWPAAIEKDFGGRAEYLLKVFRRPGEQFVEVKLENQIDRKLIESNSAVQRKFKDWLLQTENIKKLDAGLIEIPDEFLTTKGISIAPGGITRSGNRLFYKLFSQQDLERVPYSQLENLKSAGGFLRRLNESSCIGCHQTRAIGGFHFMGRDPQGRYPGNSVFSPASAHFYGDLPRRRQITKAFAKSELVDFSRGFSARPLDRAGELEGTGLLNGWGAACSLGEGDTTFLKWNCAAGLKCTTLLDKNDAFGLGICLSPAGKQIGEPCELGTIETPSWGVDVYTRKSITAQTNVSRVCSPQSGTPGSSTGGFLNGSIRTRSCEGLTPEAACGPLPAAKSGFNACLGNPRKVFSECLREYALGVGLRGCDFKNPCRDDYICVESYEKTRGACVPPYFLMQFRVDGHPLKRAR